MENHGSGKIEGLYCTGALCTIQSLTCSARHRAYLIVSLRKSRLPSSIFCRHRAFQKKLVTCLVFFLMVSRYGRPWQAICSETFHIFLNFIDFCGPLQTNLFEYPIFIVGTDFRGCSKGEFYIFGASKFFWKTPTNFGHRSHPIGNLKKKGASRCWKPYFHEFEKFQLFVPTLFSSLLPFRIFEKYFPQWYQASRVALAQIPIW